MAIGTSFGLQKSWLAFGKAEACGAVHFWSGFVYCSFFMNTRLLDAFGKLIEFFVLNAQMRLFLMIIRLF